MPKKNEVQPAENTAEPAYSSTDPNLPNPVDPDGSNYELVEVKDSPIQGHQEQVHKGDK